MSGDMYEGGTADDRARGVRVEYFLLLATLEKSYKSCLARYTRLRCSAINCHRSAFWGTSQNVTAESF